MRATFGPAHLLKSRYVTYHIICGPGRQIGPPSVGKVDHVGRPRSQPVGAMKANHPVLGVLASNPLVGAPSMNMAQCRAGEGSLLQQSSLKGRPVACFHSGPAARARAQTIKRSGRSLCATVRAENVLILNTKGMLARQGARCLTACEDPVHHGCLPNI